MKKVKKKNCQWLKKMKRLCERGLRKTRENKGRKERKRETGKRNM